MIGLNSKNLHTIRAQNPNLSVPIYLDQPIKSGIVHIGPGNFHLAHLAAMTHQLLQSGDPDALNYGIVGVSLQSAERRNLLKPQDYLYTIVEQSGAASQYEICGAIQNILFAPENPAAVIDQIASSDTRIVSLAMTGNGYYLDSSGNFMLDHPDVQHDLAALHTRTKDVKFQALASLLTSALKVKTAWGFLAAALRQRMHDSNGTQNDGLTVLCCDNIFHNGDYTKKAFLEFVAALDDNDLLQFAADKLAFPNSMVDRIVPKTTAALCDTLSQDLGYVDRMAIPAEPMPLLPWVIEDKFQAGRPNWGAVGAKFVTDVSPYEKMKLRLLNASHSVIACLGDLVGHSYIYETMEDEQIRKVMLRLMAEETVTTLDPVPGVDLTAYQQELITRFSNRAVEDTVQRVATDAPLQTVLDSICDRLNANQPIDMLGLGLAAWLVRVKGGVNEQGREIVVRHPDAKLLQEAAQTGSNPVGQLSDPIPMLAIGHIFGDIGTHPKVIATVQDYLAQFNESGIRQTMLAVLRTDTARPARGLQGPQHV